MHPDRRRFLSYLASCSAIGALAGCAGAGSGSAAGRAGLVLPLEGRFGTLGRKMVRAAELANREDGVLSLTIHDSSSDAGAAAKAAMDAGADMVLGPLLGRQMAAVRRSTGGHVPVISFSNDTGLAGPDSFVMGLAPEQSIVPILSYARGQGVKRVSVLSAPGALGERTARIAEAAASDLGLAPVQVAIRTAPGPEAAREALRLPSGRLPDAVLLPDGGPTLLAHARALSGTGLQVLGTAQWSTGTLAGSPVLTGAWFAAPDPTGFTEFSDAFESGTGDAPGVLAALAYDAVSMARTLAAAGRLDRSGLLRAEGFAGAAGRFRFRADGQCSRDLAIFAMEPGGPRVVQQAVRV